MLHCGDTFFSEFTSVALCSSYALILRILTIIYRQSLIFGLLDVNTSVFTLLVSL